MSKLLMLVGIVLLVITLVVLGPLIFLWALNTLFPMLAIPYTLATWFACLVIFGGAKSSLKFTRS